MFKYKQFFKIIKKKKINLIYFILLLLENKKVIKLFIK